MEIRKEGLSGQGAEQGMGVCSKVRWDLRAFPEPNLQNGMKPGLIRAVHPCDRVVHHRLTCLTMAHANSGINLRFSGTVS
jgi:hypothetical protein